jgi:hypothetical protein
VEVDVSVETEVLVWTLPPASVDVMRTVMVLVDVTGCAVVDGAAEEVVSLGVEVVLAGVELEAVGSSEGEGVGVDVVSAGSGLDGEGVGDADDGDGDGDEEEVGVVTTGVEEGVVAFGVLDVATGVEDVGVVPESSSPPALMPVPSLFTMAWPLCGA